MLEFVLIKFITVVGFFAFFTLNLLVLIYMEYKIMADIQVRLGPMRVGPHGTFQPIADGLKLFLKEDTVPARADKPLFWLAPLLAAVPALLLYLVIPISEKLVIRHLDLGIFYIFALLTVLPVGIIVAGWASNSKYSLLGGLRAAAQQISYEVPLLISVLGVVMIASSLNLVDIVKAQEGRLWGFLPSWFIFLQPFGFLLYFVCALAEVNRIPFDIPEAESEIVAGYFTEYSGMKFALFFLAEYSNVFVLSALGVLAFLGGWQGPVLPPLVWFFLKTYALIYLIIWIRGSLPRVRIDQLLSLGWKILLPATLVNVFITAFFLL